MSELKPCPFCGCDEIYKACNVHPKCSKCGAVQDDVQGLLAVEKWNERVVDNQLAKQQEEIAKLTKANNKLENRNRNIEEDLECVHMHLDDLGVDKDDGHGNVYSIVGRINNLLAKHNKGE